MDEGAWWVTIRGLQSVGCDQETNTKTINSSNFPFLPFIYALSLSFTAECFLGQLFH